MNNGVNKTLVANAALTAFKLAKKAGSAVLFKYEISSGVYNKERPGF